MGTSSRLSASPTSVARSAQAQPVTSPFLFKQLPGTNVAQVHTPEGKMAALAAILRFSTNQGYFIFQHVDPFLAKKAITLDTLDAVNGQFKVESIEDQLPDRRFQRIYIQVHHNAPQRLLVEHLVDHLAETTLGNTNLELKKNVTIDVFDSDGDWGLRDNAGFIVTDRLQLHQISVDSDELLKVLKPAKDISITAYNTASSKDQDDVLDFDSTLSNHNRADFLAFLFSQCTVYVARRTNEENAVVVVGYIVASKTDYRILSLYAEDQGIADGLLVHHLTQSRAKKAILCTPRAQWRKLSTLYSLKSRAIYRRHTRSVPSNVKWERIYAFNAGLNLF
uniref:N-acetyltransferase domain-containing protein n=1 Tax=Panagrellus redivivus TaxID=6233 RepID=A0A7E4URX7_PANRE